MVSLPAPSSLEPSKRKLERMGIVVLRSTTDWAAVSSRRSSARETVISRLPEWTGAEVLVSGSSVMVVKDVSCGRPVVAPETVRPDTPILGSRGHFMRHNSLWETKAFCVTRAGWIGGCWKGPRGVLRRDMKEKQVKEGVVVRAGYVDFGCKP